MTVFPICHVSDRFPFCNPPVLSPALNPENNNSVTFSGLIAHCTGSRESGSADRRRLRSVRYPATRLGLPRHARGPHTMRPASILANAGNRPYFADFGSRLAVIDLRTTGTGFAWQVDRESDVPSHKFTRGQPRPPSGLLFNSVKTTWGQNSSELTASEAIREVLENVYVRTNFRQLGV